MINTISRVISIMVLVIISVGIVIGQGLYWESTTVMKAAKDKEVHSASYYRPHMFKQSSENNSTIFRLDKEMMYLVDNEKKEYSEMTFKEMEELAKKASSAMEEKVADMETYLKEMPPEQRKAMEQMMGNRAMGGNKEAKIDVQKTSEKKSITKYACTKYVLTEAGKEVGVVWTTDDVPDFSAMQKDMKDFSRRLASRMPMRGKQMAAAMQKIEGFPIQTTIAGITTTVTKIEKKSVSVSEFEIPNGYKKVSPKDLTEDE